MNKIFQNGTWIGLSLILGSIFFTSAISKTTAAENPISQDCTIGEVAIFSGNFIPRNWEACDGKALEIQNYQYLFTIIGTYYGGDGRVYFKLPNLVETAAIHSGTGPGLSNINMGITYGAKNLYSQVVRPAKKATTSGSGVTTVTGNLSSTSNMQASLTVNYIICAQGRYPTKN